MTGEQTLIARGVLSVLIGGISVVLCSISRLRTISRVSFDRVVILSFILSRLAIFLGIFVILHITPRGDIPGFYWVEAQAVLAHLVPYRDFLCSYAPLHPYIDALAIRVWFSPLAIILLAICVESLVLPLWFRIGRIFLAEQEIRSGALLYLTSVFSVQFVAIDGQDNVIVAVLLVLGLILAYRRLAYASGAAVGFGVVAVKFLPLLYFPAFLVALPRRSLWLAGASSVIAAVFGVCLIYHLPVLQPLVFEGMMKSAGNLPFIFEVITGLTVPSLFWNALVLVVCGFVFFLTATKAKGASLPARLRILTFSCAALTLALVLFSKKSWPPYLMLSLFPICVLVRSESKLRTAAFALFSFFALVGYSYWASVLALVDAPIIHQGLVAHQPAYLSFLMMQLVMVIGYGWLFQLSLRAVRDAAELLPAGETDDAV